MPYQQKPIDLFKAIFEASDSEEEADEEEIDASGKGEQQAEDKPNAQAASLQPDTHSDPTEGALLTLQHFVPFILRAGLPRPHAARLIVSS